MKCVVLVFSISISRGRIVMASPPYAKLSLLPFEIA
jgi:hypothetical protein